MTDIISSTIQESPLFKHLSDDDVQRVVDATSVREYESGAPIIEEGARVDSLFILLEGSVKVWTRSVDREVDLKKLGPGAYFGEVSLLSGKTATATVEALAPSKALAIDRATILALVDENEKIRKMLEGLTLKRAKDTLGKVLQ